MLNWTALLPTFTVCAGGSAAPGTFFAVLDEKLMQWVLEIIRDASFTVSESGLAVDGRLTLLNLFWNPGEVLAEAEDVSVDSKRRTLQTEEQNT